MRVFLLGLPHTQLTLADGYTACAFTAKAYRLAEMLRGEGIEVVTMWGGDQADVSLLSPERQEMYFGKWDPNRLPAVEWDLNLPYWHEFNAASILYLVQNLADGDVIGSVMGGIHQPVFDAFKKDYTCVEMGVGYEGISRDTFACFESYAWMHNRYGAYGIGDGRAMDAVIPNAVDPDDWEIGPSDGYALFVGRLIWRKGPTVAADIAKAAGLRLVMAGAGVAERHFKTKRKPARIVATDGTVIEGNHVEHVGTVFGAERRSLFSRAEVLICPTLYVGPFENVHMEAAMSGTGVVAPDYGVFTESVPPASRYRNIRQAVEAVEIARATRGQAWRDLAIEFCSPQVCAPKYAEWLDRIASLRGGGKGFYEGMPD